MDMFYVRTMVIPMKDKVAGELHMVMKEMELKTAANWTRASNLQIYS